jgi:hypothetical protein
LVTTPKLLYTLGTLLNLDTNTSTFNVGVPIIGNLTGTASYAPNIGNSNLTLTTDTTRVLSHSGNSRFIISGSSTSELPILDINSSVTFPGRLVRMQQQLNNEPNRTVIRSMAAGGTNKDDGSMNGWASDYLAEYVSGSVVAPNQINGFQWSCFNGTIYTKLLNISSSGNIGIGTSTPNAKLDVNGNTRITGSLGVTGSLIVFDTTASVPYNAINTVTKQIQKVDTTITPTTFTVIDWDTETLNTYDSLVDSQYTSIDWNNRILYTPGTPFGQNRETVDWGNRNLKYNKTTAGGTPSMSIDWGAGTLNDTTGATALKWNTPGTLTVNASMVLSASVTASSGNSATSDAILQATLLYLSNNF